MLSLNKRVLISIFVGFVLGVLVVSMYAIQSIKQVRRVAAYAQASALVSGFDSTQDINQLPSTFNDAPISYTLYSKQGEVISFSDNRTQPLKLKSEVVYSRTWFPELETRGNRVGVPVTLGNGDILMVSQVDNANRELIEQVVRESFKVMLVALIHLVVVFLFIVHLTVRWTLSPIKAAASTANEISINNPQSIPIKRQPSEIMPLIKSVNGAIDRLTKAYQAQQQFIADAAHELRTPLAVLKLRLSHVQKTSGDREISQAQDEVKQIQNMTDKLLELARLEGVSSNQESKQQSVNLPHLIREVIVERYPLYEQADREMHLEIQGKPQPIVASPNLLMLAFRNLIDNALHHGVGTLTITINYESRESVQLYFKDEGISPKPELRNTLFERFKKVNINSYGSGLGLAIVKQVVTQHYGGVWFCESESTKIAIYLPLISNVVIDY